VVTADNRHGQPSGGKIENLVKQSDNLNRREFVRLLAGGAAAAGLGLPLIGCGSTASTTDKKVVVLGLDGLDPFMVKALVDTGRAPNFKKLA
jgi:hypothetical protein